MNLPYVNNLDLFAKDLSIESVISSNTFDDYFFEDAINDVNDTDDLISEFIFSYMLKVKELLNLSQSLGSLESKEVSLYMNWLMDEGKQKYTQILENLLKNRVSSENISKVLLYYDFLLETSIENGEFDALLNWLYDIPNSLYIKLKSLGYVSEEFGLYYDDYDTIKNTDYNFEISVPAAMQVFLLI